MGKMRDGIRLRGGVHWIKYSRNGKTYEESVDKALGIRGATRAQAKKLLASRRGAIADGRFFGLGAEKTEFGGFREVRIASDPCDYERDGKRYAVYGMVKELVDDYRLNKRKSTPQLLRSLWELSKHFEGFRLAHITSDQIKAYKVLRVNAGMANATINREQAALKRIFKLAQESTPPKVTAIPKIEMLEEKNVRRGFFEHSKYLAIREHMREYLRPILDCGYIYGGRKEEIKTIEWPMVDMIEGKINLGEGKNGDPRIWYLTSGLYQAFLALKLRRDREYPHQARVFVHEDGTPIENFREEWDSSFLRAGYSIRYKCKQCGTTVERNLGTPREKMVCMHDGKNCLKKDGDSLFHDLRRTAVRNMVLSGKISRKTAMLISGHLTESVFERYHIIDEADLAAATASMSEYYQKVSDRIGEYSKKVTNTVTIEEVKEKERKG